MQIFFEILRANRRVRDAINGRLIGMNVYDDTNDNTDAAWLTLDNRDGRAETLMYGDTFEVRFGYKPTSDGKRRESQNKTYIVHEMSHVGPPETMEIRGAVRDITQTSKFKTRKSRGWENLTVGEIVATIARDQGLEVHVAANLAKIMIPRRDQFDESDISFCHRLAKEIGARATIKGSFLLVTEAVDGLSRYNPKLKVINIARHELLGWRVDFVEAYRFTGVRAKWQDLDGGGAAVELVGDERSVYVIPTTFPTKAEAVRAARAELERRQRTRATGKFELAGKPELRAGGRIYLSGMLPRGEREWLVTTVEHILNSDGFVTKVTAETPSSNPTA